ncbi:WW domain-binding protein 2-like, partial [Chelydra serpentina]
SFNISGTWEALNTLWELLSISRDQTPSQQTFIKMICKGKCLSVLFLRFASDFPVVCVSLWGNISGCFVSRVLAHFSNVLLVLDEMPNFPEELQGAKKGILYLTQYK